MSQQRYEKEIEEILKKSGAAPPEPPADEPTEPPPRRRQIASPVRRISLRNAISYKGVLLTGIALLVVSAIFGGLYLFLGGVALVVAGYVMYYRAPRPGRGDAGGDSASPKMWRGRPIDPDDDPHFTNDRWNRRR